MLMLLSALIEEYSTETSFWAVNPHGPARRIGRTPSTGSVMINVEPWSVLGRK
jgi:hypothetical protein